MKLGIFNTFKTKDYLTGEANRQRAIISILSNSNNPTEKTRTGISRQIAKEQDIAWKNIYSGIFRDLDEILLPMNLVEEDGRLPLKRGPKALQEKGIPYYHLTKGGILVALSINGIEKQEELLNEFFMMTEPHEKIFEKTIMNLQKSSPNFTYLIFQKYVKAFCDGVFDLLPFDLTKLVKTHDESLITQRELLKTIMIMPKHDTSEIVKLLDAITTDNTKH